MSEDEQLQVKKDLLWEIHETKKLVACLETNLDGQIEKLEDVVKIAKAGKLDSHEGQLVEAGTVKRDRGSVSFTPLEVPARETLANTVRELCWIAEQGW